MNNLNKTYHKGKFRELEWGKHLRRYLKRVGNKKFRRAMLNFEQDEYEIFKRAKSKRNKRLIKVKVTHSTETGGTVSYYKRYRTLRALNDSVKRSNVIRYTILNDKTTR